MQSRGRPAAKAPPGYMTPRAVAELLGKHPATVYRWITSGVLEADTVGANKLVKRDAVRAFVGGELFDAFEATA